MKLKKKSQYFPINQTFFAHKNKPHTQIYICLEEFNSKSNWKWRVTLKWRNFSHFLHFFDIIFQSLSREELFSLKCHQVSVLCTYICISDFLYFFFFCLKFIFFFSCYRWYDMSVLLHFFSVLLAMNINSHSMFCLPPLISQLFNRHFSSWTPPTSSMFPHIYSSFVRYVRKKEE